MSIRQSTDQYEKWMATHIQPVRADLDFKHRQMRLSPFLLMRGTFYRWVELWNDQCKDEAGAPPVLAVGDLHIENFGTWRDLDGRLIWGVNDFDEAFPLPYTIDLVRLATSAHIAIREQHLSIRRREACDAILQGYVDGLKTGGVPFVLGEKHAFLRTIALGKLRDPVRFWEVMRSHPNFKGKLSRDAVEALERLLPAENLHYSVKTRRAGMGSLGRQRFVAVADWRGGPMAREIKSALPSACVFAGMSTSDGHSFYSQLLSTAVRMPDPLVQVHRAWIVRRLAPDCTRIELEALPEKRDEARLLEAMGFETANVHLGTRDRVRHVLKDLERRPAKWLHEASRRMTKLVEADWNEWRKGSRI
jgi:hypothetical protein